MGRSIERLLADFRAKRVFLDCCQGGAGAAVRASRRSMSWIMAIWIIVSLVSSRYS
jgi:hypothetical protein